MLLPREEISKGTDLRENMRRMRMEQAPRPTVADDDTGMAAQYIRDQVASISFPGPRWIIWT